MTDRFRLVRQRPSASKEELKEQLRNRRTAAHLVEHQKAAPRYQLDLGLETAINTALAVGSPLLVTGEPGTGKTQLAYYLADYFEIKLRAFLVKSQSTARDLMYAFDAVGYLQSAYAMREGGDSKVRMDFVDRGPLWQVYEDPEPSVLLIDEIDKAPRDFPNDLLHELDQAWFPHPFSPGQRITAKMRPIVVITSNVERRLPGAFLRRCVFHHIELTEKLIQEALRAREEDFRTLDPAIRRRAVERFWDLRNEHELHKPPSTAELLLWLAVLEARGTKAEELEVPDAELPALGTLVKDLEDQKKL